LLAKPAQWSGVLVVHAHGGPALGEPKASRADEDIKRWSITLTEGHAWAGSVFRQGGFAVTTAAEDTERVRRIFVDHVAKPQRTLLHGQSWGAMAATRAAELYPKSWEGILLTSGVVAGPSTYDFRLDLRAIYQHLCQNHPRPDEPQYPLALGLPANNPMKPAELTARINDCLALRKPAAQRSPEQAQKIKTIVDVLKIPESSIAGHLNWGTFTLQDVVTKSGGASPFGNDKVNYTGSSNDAALNAAVLRFKADPQASAKFDADVNHHGRFKVPVLTAHGIRDSTVFVEGHDTLRTRMASAGNAGQLVQTYVDSSEHSYLGEAIYPPLLRPCWLGSTRAPNPRLRASLHAAWPCDRLKHPSADSSQITRLGLWPTASHRVE
jgi:pimeloyl-ACP methyl ester carboxylesterase